MIYLDNSATTYPKPLSVRRKMAQALEQFGANPGRGGFKMSLQTAQAVYDVRQKAASFFGAAGPESISFQPSCTQSLNIVIHSLKRGDHVLVTDLEHNAVYRVVDALCRQGVIDYDIAQVVDCDEQTVWNFEHLIRHNTRLIACTQGSNVFGYCVPVGKIGAMAHRRGVLMLVDAAQTAGLLDIDLRHLPIDYLCLPGHKGLYGPAGTGILIVNGKPIPDPLCEGGTGSFSMEAEMPDFLPDRLESGTVNTSGIIGLGKGIDFVRTKTPQRLYQAEMQLCRRLYRNLSAIPGVQLYSDEPQIGKNLPLIAFQLQGLGSEQTAALLNDYGIAVRAGFHCAALAHRKMGTHRDGTVRVSLGAFNTQQEADAFCRAVADILRRQRNGKKI